MPPKANHGEHLKFCVQCARLLASEQDIQRGECTACLNRDTRRRRTSQEMFARTDPKFEPRERTAPDVEESAA